MHNKIVSLLVTLCFAFPFCSAAPIRPHVIFIVADDLGFGDLSLTGFSDVRTPHIDALHAQGLRMTRYYGQPVCSPSRAAIHTGRLPLSYGLQTYVIDPEGVDYGLEVRFFFFCLSAKRAPRQSRILSPSLEPPTVK